LAATLSAFFLGGPKKVRSGCRHQCSRACAAWCAEMDLRETARGRAWTASGSRPASAEITPGWPYACPAVNNQVNCGPGGMQGTLAMNGVGKRRSAALVKVLWLDGRSRVHTIAAGQPGVRLYGSADDPPGHGRDRLDLWRDGCRAHPVGHRSPAVCDGSAVRGGFSAPPGVDHRFGLRVDQPAYWTWLRAAAIFV